MNSLGGEHWGFGEEYIIVLCVYIYNTYIDKTCVLRYTPLDSRARVLGGMHYESEITLEYPTHTYECIKGAAGGDIDSFGIL